MCHKDTQQISIYPRSSIIAFYLILLVCKDQVKQRRQRLPRGPLDCQKGGPGSLFKGKGNPYTRGLWPKKLTSFQIVTGRSSLKMCIFASEQQAKPQASHFTTNNCIRALLDQTVNQKLAPKSVPGGFWGNSGKKKQRSVFLDTPRI